MEYSIVYYVRNVSPEKGKLSSNILRKLDGNPSDYLLVVNFIKSVLYLINVIIDKFL